MSNLWVLPEELGDLADSEYAYEACRTASYLLWGMSGRKFSGTNTVTETYAAISRPIDPRLFYVDHPQAAAALLAMPRELPGATKIRLRGQPVQTIVSVTNADGDVFSEDEYILWDRQYVQFFRSLAGDLTINYTYGAQPPIAGRMAARKLAMEFAMLWEGNPDCSLPSRVTSVSREGLSYTILDNQDFIADMRTGVYEVDLFLKTVNPDNARKRSRVLTADQRRGRKTRGGPSTTSGGWTVVPGQGN